MWLITGIIEPQMSRNVPDSGLCLSIYVIWNVLYENGSCGFYFIT